MKRIIGVIVVGVVLLLAIAIPYACNTYARSQFKEMETSQEKLRELLPRFQADVQKLSAKPLFPNWSRTRDAGSVLEKWVSVEGHDIELLQTPSHVVLRELFPQQQVASAPEEIYRRLAADPRIASVETEWMNELLQYDYWRPESLPQMQAYIEKGRDKRNLKLMEYQAQSPMPKYVELRHFATVHFIKLAKAGKAREGLVVVRKVAELMHSAGNIVAESLGLSMIAAEASLADFAKVMDWSTFTEEEILRHRRASWAWTGYLSFLWTTGLPAELEAAKRPQTGFCAGASEFMTLMAFTPDFFEGRVPFEVDLSQAMSRMRTLEVEMAENCGKPIPDHGTLTARLLAMRNPAMLPFIRRSFGSMLLMMLIPSSMRHYDESP